MNARLAAIVVALAACGTPAPPPAQPLANVKPEPVAPPPDAAPRSTAHDRIHAKLVVFRDQLCGCATAADPKVCVQAVSDLMAEWATTEAGRNDSIPEKPTAQDVVLGQQIGECMSKAMSAPQTVAP